MQSFSVGTPYARPRMERGSKKGADEVPAPVKTFPDYSR